MADETTIEVVLASESTVGNPIVETVTVIGTVPVGPRGIGVPPGGSDGQVLAKASATDFDTEWVDQTGGPGGSSFPLTGDVSAAGHAIEHLSHLGFEDAPDLTGAASTPYNHKPGLWVDATDAFASLELSSADGSSTANMYVSDTDSLGGGFQVEFDDYAIYLSSGPASTDLYLLPIQGDFSKTIWLRSQPGADPYLELGNVLLTGGTTLKVFAGTGIDGTSAPTTPAALADVLVSLGVLASHTIPDMATQAELDAHTGGVDPHGDRAYADSLFAANDALLYKGVIDCSANPNYPAASAGHTYRISVAGKLGGASGVVVEAGDMAICVVDGSAAGTQAAVGANWDVIQTNHGVLATVATSGAYSDLSGLPTLGTAAATNTGTGATNTILGNDARLTDTRTPTDNTVTTAKLVDDAVTNAKAANMAQSTFKGRAASAGTGDPTDLTPTQAIAILGQTGSALGTAALKDTGTSSGQVPLNSDLPTLSVTNDLTLSGGQVGRTGMDVQVFTADGTWTKPANATLVRVIATAGGAGGASGRKGAAGSLRGGGGGGQGGFTSIVEFLATDLAATVAVVVGAGGAGGTAISTDSTSGNDGTAGGNSTFGTTLVVASGGHKGEAGTAVAGGAGGGLGVVVSTKRGSFRSTTGANGGDGTTAVAVSGGGHVGCGGGGGGIPTGNTPQAGGAGTGGAGGGAGTGGAATGAAGNAGTAGTSGSPGGGGGGGGASSGSGGGTGGAGASYGAGGGGGGASTNGASNNSGAGGAGANGSVVVITIF